MTEDLLPYESDEYQRFNESLDKDGKIYLAQTPFDRSYLLYKTDPALYKDAYQNFSDEEFDILKRLINDEYPSCIAYHFRHSEKGEGAFDPVKKLYYLKDVWESVIFVVYAIVLGEIRYKGIKIDSLQMLNGTSSTGTPMYQRINKDQYTTDKLKIKAKIIKTIISHSKDNNIGLKCELIPTDLLDDLLSLQDIRNGLSHHATPSTSEAENDLRLVSPLFREMLFKTKFLAECRILRFESYSNKCRCQEFRGYSLNTEYENFNFGTRLHDVLNLGQDHLFVKWDDEVFSVSPFLHYKKVNEQSHLCVFKRITGNAFVFEPTQIRGDISFSHLESRFNAEKDYIRQLATP